MNYLLFVYYDNTVEDSEIPTNQIGNELSEQSTSNQVKFMFGDKHAIFHFASNLTMDEMGGWIDIISDDLQCFQFILTPKSRSSYSNMAKDNLDYLLSLKKTNIKKQTPTPPKSNKKINFGDVKNFMDISDLILNLRKEEVCDMTLDELLDKIKKDGMKSLSELEKQKLDEYSKSI